MKSFPLALFCVLTTLSLTAQNTSDSLIFVGEKAVTLSEIVLSKKLDVPHFIQQIQQDSSFYKAFKNLHLVGYTALNDIRKLKKNGDLDASLFSKTRQIRENGCRKMEVLEETVVGQMFDDNHEFIDYTPKMYASLFFTKGTICGENNIVGDADFDTRGLSGMEKRKAQLKQLFFNPGHKISGIPFLRNKTEIYSDGMAEKYDMAVGFETFRGEECYTFSQTARPGKGDGVVVDRMKTWFNEKTMDVVARTYALSYDAAFYDMKVDMEVQLSKIGSLSVPVLIRYNGNWHAVTKGRERYVFTATLFDFKN